MTAPKSKSPFLSLWKKLNGEHNVIGRKIASFIVCNIAPYFSTIKPTFTKVEPGHVELVFKKRRRVHNHIKTVHAIAMCNAAELAMGVCADISLRGDFRWIPSGMTVRYLKMAKTDLRAVCKLESWDWDEKQKVIMPVSIYDTNNEEVFQAEITINISPKPQK